MGRQGMNEGGEAGKQFLWTWSQGTLIIFLILLPSGCVTLGQSQPSQASVSSCVKIKWLCGLYMISNVSFSLKCQLCSSGSAHPAPLCHCLQQPSLSLLWFLYLEDISPQVLETAMTVTVCNHGSWIQDLSSSSLTCIQSLFLH